MPGEGESGGGGPLPWGLQCRVQEHHLEGGQGQGGGGELKGLMLYSYAGDVVSAIFADEGEYESQT